MYERIYPQYLELVRGVGDAYDIPIKELDFKYLEEGFFTNFWYNLFRYPAFEALNPHSSERASLNGNCAVVSANSDTTTLVGRNFDNNKYNASIELYYKDMQNLIEYENGADIFLNEFIESQLVFGDGWSYGLELFVEKKIGRFTGWLSYTLSQTERQFDEINDGESFPARQDRTHDISIVGMYELNDKWSLSANWIYYTGLAATYPAGKYTIDGMTANYYTDRNAQRMPDYHRLDLGATYFFKKTDKEEMSLTFSLYNAYARENAYTINFEESESDPNVTQAVKLSLFSIFPSLTFNFRF